MLERTPAGLRSAIISLLIVGMPTIAFSQTSPTADVAIIVVRVPSDAKVVLADGDTSATGTERTFVTPTLGVKRKYSYVIVGTWTEGGKAKRVARTVRFKAGDSVVVDLTQPEADKPKEAPKVTEKPKEKPKAEEKPKPKEELKGAEKLKMPKVEKEKKKLN